MYGHKKSFPQKSFLFFSLHSYKVHFSIQVGFQNISSETYAGALDKQTLTVCTSEHLDPHSDSAPGVPL